MSRVSIALAVLALTLLAACDSAKGSGARPNASTVGVTTTTPVALRPADPYRPLEGEPAPEAKQRAADAVQAIATYPKGGGTVAAAAARLVARGFVAPLAEGAGPVLDPGRSSEADIVYPQLGGLTTSDASVLVVVRQRLLGAGAETAVTRTVDVRLNLVSGAWSPTAIASFGGEPVAVANPDPAQLTNRVLANPNIELPDSARWDIAAGRISERVLGLLLDLAQQHRLKVTVLETGHPHEVFHKASVSNHTRGRAVDIWSVDDRPVIEQRDPAGPLAALVRQLLADGVTELGSPFRVGPGSFTDTVHQDHLHLGYDA